MKRGRRLKARSALSYRSAPQLASGVSFGPESLDRGAADVACLRMASPRSATPRRRSIPAPAYAGLGQAAARLWRYAWAFPATLVGLCVACVARAGGATVHRVDGVLEVAGGRLGPVVGRLPARFRFCAITFGHVVVGGDHRALDECRKHEHAHVRQYERWGVLFFPLYAASSLWATVRGIRPYHDNHFERQARAVAQSLASVVAKEPHR